MKMLLTSAQPKCSLRSVIKAVYPVALSSRFRHDERGVAAIEFAIIAPIMIGMYFGLAEIASAIGVDRRVSHSTNVAGDLATQTSEIRDGEIEEIVSAALRVLDVPDVSKVAMDMESFILPDAGNSPESRGRIRVNTGAGSLGDFDASGLDTKILNEDSGVVVTRMSYKYSPLKLRFMKTDITLKETFLLKPRRSNLVQIQDGMDSLIDCTATSFANVTCTVTN